MLEIDSLSKTYPNEVQALHDVSLEIGRGMFGLLGPNGAGKSTLMRTVATLQSPDTGSIRFDGQDIALHRNRFRRRLGYLPQEFGAYPRTSLQSMLNHLAVLKGIVDKKARRMLVERLMVQTNLWEHRKQSIDAFSGGMRQRFGIAQALIGEPELIIVDEPTAGLDPAERRRFHNLLVEIGADVVVILSTHIVDDVAELCPRVAIMGKGRILVEGEPRALVERLEGRLWRKLVDRSEVAALRATAPVVSTRMVMGKTEVRLLGEAAPEAGMTTATPTLEDVYFATLIGHGIEVTT